MLAREGVTSINGNWLAEAPFTGCLPWTASLLPYLCFLHLLNKPPALEYLSQGLLLRNPNPHGQGPGPLGPGWDGVLEASEGMSLILLRPFKIKIGKRKKAL